MYTHTIIVTIGRSVAGKPMPDGQWLAFKGLVYGSLEQAGCDVVQQPRPVSPFDQLGTWRDIIEEAACFVAFIEGHENIRWLRSRLKTVAAIAKQETIGLITVIGTDHLIHTNE